MYTDLSPYREEIVSNDRWHKSVAWILSLVIVGLTIAHQITDSRPFIAWVPLLVVALLGVIIRLEVLVHRQGEFLKESGDFWEEWRPYLKHDRKFLVFADLMCILPVVAALVYAYSNLGIDYNAALVPLIVFEMLAWVMAPKFVRMR